jgi:5'-3' exonuclease
MTAPIAIIDGDVLCHLACKNRWEKKVPVILNENNELVTYVRLDADGKRKPLEYTKDEDRLFLEESWENFRRHLDSLLEALYWPEYLMAVKGENNYRNRLYPEYKQHRHRDPTKQNVFVPILRQLAVAEDIAIAADEIEADDLIRIWAEQAKSAGIDYIICSIDKDLKCISGKHWDVKKNIMIHVSEEEAMQNYYIQLLKGDPTDNIMGVPGIGDVKAQRLLAGCTKEDDYQKRVAEQYIAVYGKNWFHELVLNGRMIHIMRAYDDYFNPRSWPFVVEYLEYEKRRESNEEQNEIRRDSPIINGISAKDIKIK